MPALAQRFRIAALCAALLAATPAEEDPLDAARDLHRTALRAYDIWTCLQLEAWAASRDERMREALRQTELYGDALFAFPRDIRAMRDLGHTLVVATEHRVFHLSPSGRPLRTTLPLPFTTSRVGISDDGGHVVAARLVGPDGDHSVELAGIDLADGEETWRARAPLGKTPPHVRVSVSQAPRVASDGSAAAVSVSFRVEHNQTTRVVVGRRKGADVVPGCDDVRAVGPDGAWLLTRNRALEPRYGWYVGTRLESAVDLHHDRSASGGGIAVLRTGDGFLRIDAAGQGTDWQPTGIEANERCHRIAEISGYLLIEIDRALTADDTGAPDGTEAPDVQGMGADLLGQAVEDDPEQAAAEDDRPRGERTTLIYRWADLADDPAAAPVYRVAHALQVADTWGPALWIRHGTRLDRLDLSTDTPERIAVASLPDPLHWIDGNHHHYTARFHDDSVAVLDHHGRVLWREPPGPQQIHVLSHDYALRHQGDHTGFALLTLDRDPDARSALEIPIPAGTRSWHVRFSPTSMRLVAGRNESWVEIDTANGRVIDRGGLDPAGVPRRRPHVDQEPDNHGQVFRPRDARLVRVADAAECPPERRWAIADATRLGRTPLVLTRGGGVFARDRRDTWQELGRTPGADHICTVEGQSGPFLADRHNNPLAMIKPGPEVAEPPPGAVAEDLGHGDWTVRWNGHFSPPGRLQTYRWNEERFGFAPERLRGIGRSHLLAFTPCVVLVLDPRAAQAFSVEVE